MTSNETVVAIDGMYIIYHAIFRTIRIWQYKNKLEAAPYFEQLSDGRQHNLLDSETFVSGLHMSIIHTCQRITDIVSDVFPQYKYAGLEPTSYATHLFMLDDKTSNSFRRTLHPEYKLSRVAVRQQQPFDIVAIRTYVLNYLLDELDIWNRLGYTKVFVDGAEADDIIYMLMTKFDKFKTKIVIASDKDLLQIPNTLQYDLSGKLITRKNRHGVDISSNNFLLKKILMGDGSDNIKAIHPRCGNVTAEKYIEQPNTLKNILAENKDAAERFIANKQLIDMSAMPDTLKTAISTALTTALEKAAQTSYNLDDIDILDNLNGSLML